MAVHVVPVGTSPPPSMESTGGLDLAIGPPRGSSDPSPVSESSGAQERKPLLDPRSQKLLEPRSQRPGPPVERRHAGVERLCMRDEWNLHELRLGDLLARGSAELPDSFDHNDLRKLLSDFHGEPPNKADLEWMMRLATHGRRPSASIDELHYALRAQHALQHFSPRAARLLATADLGPRGSVNWDRLEELMLALNQGGPLLKAELDLVIEDAEVLGGQRMGRKELLRAVAGWYLHVGRKDTDWLTLLRAWLGRWWLPREYHVEVMERLTVATRALASQLEACHGSDSHVDASPMLKAIQVLVAAVQAAALLVALVLPSGLFGWLVLVGAQHGDDRCPWDLDGLMTWFGVLGLASLVVSCADGILDQPSGVIVALRVALVIFPWIGTFWTFHLNHEEQGRCGPFLYSVSAFVWTSLLLMEVIGVCVFCWGAAVMTEHETSLRHSLRYAHPGEP